MRPILGVQPTPRYAPKDSILYTEYDLARIRFPKIRPGFLFRSLISNYSH